MDNGFMEKMVLNIDKSTWKMTKLGDLLDDISQRVDNPSQSGYERFVGLEHFVSGDIKIKNWGTTENLTSSAKAFKAGDILFARRNAYLRRASLVDFDGCCSGDAFVLRENRDKVVPGFMGFFFNSNAVWDFANENAAGTMSQRVKWRDLANYEFLLPPKDQQAQLAELLWAMDEVVERERNMESALSILWRSHRLTFFQKSNWRMKRLGDFFEVQLGKMLSRKAKQGNSPSVYLANKNVQWGRLDLKDLSQMDFDENEKKKFSLKIGDILVCEGGEVGRTAIWNGELEDCYYQKALHRLRVINRKYIPEVMLQFMFCANSQNLFTRLTGHSTIPHLTAIELKEFRIPEIPIEEQMRMKLKFNSLREIDNRIFSKLTASRALQKSLINQIF